MEHAARVVGMAGYNSVCEIVGYAKPALLVPREAPRLEQAIRARRFAQLGLVHVLSSAALSSEALTKWMAGAPAAPQANQVAFTALEQVSRRVSNLFRGETQAVPAPAGRLRAMTTAGAHVH